MAAFRRSLIIFSCFLTVLSIVSMDSGKPFLSRCSNQKLPEIKMINEDDNTSTGESIGVRKKKGIVLSKPRQIKLKNIAATSSLSSTSSSAAPSNHVRRAYVNPSGKRSKISSKDGTFEDLALPMGMSFAAIISQVLDEINRSRKQMPVEQLSLICTSALKESVANIYGNGLDSLLTNFEKSFGSTLRTLRKIKEASVPRHQCRSSQIFNKADVAEFNEQSIADKVEMQFSSQLNNKDFETLKDISPLAMETNQIIPHRAFSQELASSSHNLSGHRFSQSVKSTFEKSVMEQTRSNDLKAFEIDLNIRKLKLKESQLAVSTYANILERVKISMGTVKASFKEEKLRNQMLDSKHADFLRWCSDLLVSGLVIMSICLGYGAYTFSYQRIAEAILSCSATATSKESSSWWMPKQLASFNSGLASFNSGFHALSCQVNAFSPIFFGLAIIMAIAYSVFQRSSLVNSPTRMPLTFIIILGFVWASFNSGFHALRSQVMAFSRMFFGLAIIMAIAYSVFQRSSSVNSPTTMPLTFIIILGFMCGLAGKLCIDTLGGSGNYWLFYWETLCLVHFLANMFPSILYRMLYGSISLTAQMKAKGRIVPYWMRRLAFNLFVALLLPAMCGLLPFASVADWMVQIAEKFNYLYYIQDSG